MNIKRISHNKLIRDNIPSILDSKNITYELETLSSDKYIECLLAKVFEEFCEFEESKTIEELADLLEVLNAIKDFYGWSTDEVEQIRQEKIKTNGGFNKRLYLIDTRELEEN